MAEGTLALAVGLMRPGVLWSDIACLMQHNVQRNGYDVVREFTGHGIGTRLVEEPPVPNFTTSESRRRDFRLRPGMTLTVEPMVLSGRRDVTFLSDGWTVAAEDGMPAAHLAGRCHMGWIRITEEQVRMYEGLRRAVGDEVADKLCPGVRHHVAKLRAGVQSRTYVREDNGDGSGAEVQNCGPAGKDGGAGRGG